MAINMMCTNTGCRFYWEDCCQRNLEELRHEIGRTGKCLSFLPGVCRYYEDENRYLDEDESKWIELEIPKKRENFKNRRKLEVYSEVERILVYQGYGILRENTYNVTIISECEGRGKNIAKCNTIIGAYTLIKILNMFYPHTNELLVDGKTQEASKDIWKAIYATRIIVGSVGIAEGVEI